MGKQPDYMAIVAHEEHIRVINRDVRETAVLLLGKLHATVNLKDPDLTLAELLDAARTMHLCYEVIEAIGERV